jgi:hypothetical protein
MTAITFDTLKYANTLKAAGIAPEQAEAQAVALSDVLEVNLKELSTKGDIVAIQKDILSLEQRMDARLIQLEQRMTIKLGGMMMAAVALVAALVKVL